MEIDDNVNYIPRIYNYTCLEKCCSVQIAEYTKRPVSRYSGRKAGVCIYDPVNDSVLLVQSRGYLWGIPKGTLECKNYIRETNTGCAIREVKEETGLDLDIYELQKVCVIRNRAVYYYAERKQEQVQLQLTPENDANGITWMKLDCLEDCIREGKIVLNQHTRILLKKFLNRTFPMSDFTLVVHKRRRRRLLLDNK